MKVIAPSLIRVFPIVTVATLLQFCAPTASTSTSSSVYQEDLSVHRPDYEMMDEVKATENEAPEENASQREYVEPTNDIKSELDTVIYRIQKSRESIEYVDGYSIQLYSGNSRDRANQIKVKTYEVLDDMKPRVSYDQPNYKVRIGEYFSRLEANADFVTLQKSFSRAVLVPIKIRIVD